MKYYLHFSIFNFVYFEKNTHCTAVFTVRKMLIAFKCNNYVGEI